jgi:uncharacterized repeat protein (TIGR03803 family)
MRFLCPVSPVVAVIRHALNLTTGALSLRACEPKIKLLLQESAATRTMTAATVFLTVFFIQFFSLTAQSAERQALRNHVPAAVANSAPVNPGSRWGRLDLVIGLPLRNQASLATLIQELYDPAGTNFHRYLTPEQFAERFGPSESDYQTVINFAKMHGLTVTGTHPNRTLVEVKGMIADIERAFHTHIRTYQHPTESRTFYAPDSEPSLDLAVPVLAISGLDNYVVPHPMVKPLPFDHPKPNAGSGPFGYYLGYDFRRAYVPGVSLTGAGQSVALVEFDGYYPQDIVAYKALAGLPDVPVTKVLLDGFSGLPGQGNIEVALDIDMAISMAPGLSQVIVYEGSNPNSVLNRIATDRLARQISASWNYSINAATIQIFQQYAAQGQSFFNSSGDGGAYSGPVATPSDSPYITIVGGTDLTMTSGGGAWVSETTWPFTGGGISTTYSIPSWQQGIDMSANRGSTTMRNLPDVSMIGNNVWLIFNNGQNVFVGGTSIGTPLWAAFTALVNELALANGEPVVGFINPAVYALAKGPTFTSIFHDIKTGNNRNAGSPVNFSAVTGYDLCTGWGTPTGSNLITGLALPEPLRVTPASAAIISGQSGGPFSPDLQSFSLTNNGTGSLNWSLVNTSVWFSVSPVGGALIAGGPATTVNIGLTAAASNLIAGTYTATLRFTNLNDNFGQSRPLTLAVITPPVITSQPADQNVLQGATASFTVATASNALLFFQWQLQGTNLSDGGGISGAATRSLTISNVATANVGTYSVIVSNSAGVLPSSNAILSILPSAPVVTTQPANQSVLPGAPASFSVAAIGNTPFYYQWQFYGTNLSNGQNFSGVTNSTVNIGSALPANSGPYSVVISNSIGSTTSFVAVLSLIPISLPGVNLTTFSSFADPAAGQNLYCPLVQGAGGNFYGTTIQGGANGLGTLFRATATGSRLTLFSFNSTSGDIPFAGLLLGKDGNLYGTTYEGGTYNAGTVFRTGGNGINFVSLTSFNVNNGMFPVAPFAQGKDGNFYGTTLQGGAYGYGTIFKMTTGGTITTLASLNGANGAYPSSTLVQGTDGNFYGTAESGGTTGGAGTVFRISPAGLFTSLYAFSGGADGATPIPGLVEGADGSLFGTTLQGGSYGFGTIFQITKAGGFTSLYSFAGGNDGANPWGGLLLSKDGNLYGTTQAGGVYGFGTVFRIPPNGHFAPLAHFDGYNGVAPSAALIQGTDGNLYGTTQTGGPGGGGTLFQLNFDSPLEITGQPANQSTYLGGSAVFSVATFGGLPVSYQWQKDGHNLTDSASVFGSTNRILNLTNITLDNLGIYSVIVSNASRSLTSDNAVLGITFSPPFITAQPTPQTRVEGATAIFTVTALGDLPLIYQWQQNGTNVLDGGNVSGSGTSTLTINNVTAANAGVYSVLISNSITSISSVGAMLAVVPPARPGTSLSSLHSFNGSSEGAFSYAGLAVGKDGNLYGTASGGGTRYAGSIFKLTPAGAFTSLYSFQGGQSGAYPYGALAQAADGNFYGTTVEGGIYGYGTLFRMSPAGSVSFLYSFNAGGPGAFPLDGLTLGPDGNYYGTAEQGGLVGYGSVFRLTTNGTVSTVFGFSGDADGAYPYAGLTLGSDGKLYGTTQLGGPNGYGTIFQLGIDGVLTTLFSFGYTNGADPAAGIVRAPDGTLYGATYTAGPGGYGTIFQLLADGTLNTLVSFDRLNGGNPIATMALGTDGALYGATSIGGVGGEGTVFRVTTNGALTTLIWFDGFNGAGPQAALVQAPDGNFYGTTTFGGVGYNRTSGGGNGTVFRITVPIFTNNPFVMPPAIAALSYTATLPAHATSVPSDPLSFAKLSGPSWLNISSDGTLSGTPADANLGTNNFTVSLSDSNGLSATATMTIVVNSNLSPSFTSTTFTEPWPNVDQFYSVSISGTATDPELGNGDRLTFAKVSGPSWLSVTDQGGLQGIPNGSNAGTNTFLISVTDLDGSSNTATFYIYVNSAPYFIGHQFSKSIAVAGLPYSDTIATNATDLDLPAGDTLTFYKVNGPLWLNVTLDGRLSGTPSDTNVGTNSFLLLVTDSAGLAGIGSMMIMVNADSPPAFKTNPFNSPDAHAGLPYSATISANATDPNPGDVLTFSKLSGPTWLSVTPGGALAGTPSNSNSGTNSFFVTVTDLDGLSGQAQMLVNVISPITVSLSRLGSQLVLSWTGGKPPYQVVTAGTLAGGIWSNLGAPLNTNTFILTPTNAAAFYRVQGQ